MDFQKQYTPVRLHYQLCVPDLHDPELSPIILLHGIGALHSSWNRVNTRIADKTRRKVFALDLRNHGQSEWTEQSTLHDYVVDVENFLSENKITKCILIGHSFGGRIAMFLALRKPHLVEMIITEDIVLSVPTSKEEKELLQVMAEAKKINMLPKDLNEMTVRNILSKLISVKYPDQHVFAFCAPLKKCSDGWKFDFNIEAVEKSVLDKSISDFDLNGCQKFTGPALIIYAEGSPVKVEQDEKMKEFFPNAKFHKFETGAHVLHAEKPHEYIKTVSDFINKDDALFSFDIE